jgi:hypothetical protein
VNPQTSPSGQAPSGTFRGHSRRLSEGVVTCLTVSGNHAAIAGYGTLHEGGSNFFGNPPPVRQAGFLLIVEDNGPFPADVTPLSPYPWSNDRALLHNWFAEAPADCSIPSDLSGLSTWWVGAGDVTVHDAPALPTTQQQCKNGGWGTYGVFKNQGDCVSFVATKGKNPPAH